MANDWFAFHHVYARIVLMLVYLHQGELKSQPKSSGYHWGADNIEQMRAATYSSQYKQQQQEQQQT
jgi:hypothetical protein